VTICDICDGHKLSQFWICDLVCTYDFFLVLSAKLIWSQFGQKYHKWSQIQMWLVQTCFKKNSTWLSQGSADVATDIRFFARLLSRTPVEPLLRIHSATPTHDFPLELPHVSQVFLEQLANPHVIQVGWAWDEGICQCSLLMDSPWREYRSRESLVVVVEVLGIHILHLANLQRGRRRMVFMLGSGRNWNYILCGKKEKPTGLYLCVIIQ